MTPLSMLSMLYLEQEYLTDLVWQNAATLEHRRRLTQVAAEIALLEAKGVDERWKKTYEREP